MNPDPIRLIIADDHLLVREGLVSLLNDEPDIQVIGHVGNGEDAIQSVAQLQPDLLLLDITMPGLTGLEAMDEILRLAPQVKIIVLTMHEEEAFFFEALRLGAAGYLLKGASKEELLFAIRIVHRQGIYLSPRLVGLIVSDYLANNPEPDGDDPLSPREREVMMLIAQGMTNSMIAKRLSLSLNTVKTHRMRIYQKLNLTDRASLVAYAVQKGLLHPRRKS